MKTPRERIAELRESAERADRAGGFDPQAVALVLTTMVKFKAGMKKKNLRRAWTNCPRVGCGGKLRATLNGSKDHMHCACTNTECHIRFME